MLQTEIMNQIPKPHRLDVGSRVEIILEGEDHGCATVGQTGEIVARHDCPGVIQYLVALDCGHGCLAFFFREQLVPTTREPRPRMN